MKISDIRSSGHAPSLLSAFLHFDISFMVWVILGALSPFISAEMHLSASQKGLLIAVPLLGSAFFRVLFGFLSDKFGSKRVGIGSLIATLIPLVWGWLFAKNFSDMLFVGALLGIAGASFAISLPLASRWYPPEMQGLVMGIAGMGNSGTVLATLFAPMLAKSYGWHAVLGLLTLPIIMVLVVFAALAKDAPGARKATTIKAYLEVVRQKDAFVFCVLYFITFGGFVGLSSFLNGFFVDQFHVVKASVGILTAPLIISGSVLRPVGGAFADRIGGIRMLSLLYSAVIVSMVGVGFSMHSQLAALVLLFIGMGCLGMGNGSVFQLVPQRFRSEIGAITGLVGAVGGVGGFYLNVVLGSLKDAFGTYASGFWVFALTALGGLIVLRLAAPGSGYRPRLG